CDKKTKLMASLDAQCKSAPAKGCSVLGEATLDLPGDKQREQADALFQKACNAGNGDACARSGDLQSEREPANVHAPIALRAYEKSCALRSAAGCCALEGLYSDQGKEAQAAKVHQKLAAIPGAGCGSGEPIRKLPPRAVVEVVI